MTKNTKNNSATATLTIDLGAISNNYRLLKRLIGTKSRIAGVLKANAYGLGIKQVVQTLNARGCHKFFVATLEEGIQLRQIDPKTSIGILGGLFVGAEQEYRMHNLTPVLNSLEEIHSWQHIIKQCNKSYPAIIHFDTGMNRLGLDKKETRTLLSNLSLVTGIDLQMIMSHFACADEKDHPLTKEQRHDFDNISQHFPNIPRSLNNSSGVFNCPNYHYEVVRPGIAMYGGNPTPETDNPMNQVVSLSCRILQIRNVSKEETVGYGASYIFSQNAEIATIALGYADGFFRSNSSRAKVFFKGQVCPVVGRVSMDLVTIEIGHLQNKPSVGDQIEIIGPNQTIDDLAKSAGTISYEILTSLGHRYQRQYING